MIKICKLEFENGYHINAEGIGLEKTSLIIHSDTLAGAILSVWYGGRKENKKFNTEDMFLISSAFPYVGEVRFLPRPRIAGPEKLVVRFIGEKEKREIKRKKIKFLSEEMFLAWIKGEKKPGIALHGGEFLITEGEEEQVKEIFKQCISSKDNKQKKKEEERGEKIQEGRIYEVRETPHVVIDRMTSRTDIYYFSDIVFRKGCGLYFFLKPGKGEWEMERIEALIKEVGRRGIGGKKTWGKGQFEVECREWESERKFEEDANYFVTLSLYWPEKDEIEKGIIDGDKVSYDLIRRGGWITQPGYLSYRKKSVMMFTEGSVFKDIGKERYGKIGEVTPEGVPFPVYRYGLAFRLKVNI